MKKYFFLFFIFIPFLTNAQIVEEKIQLDTIAETIKVIYKPTIISTYYFKKVGVFADDTSQIAIEKSYTNYGQNGLYKVYYPNGRLKIKTVFANDKINGEWTYYDSKGIIIIKGNYKGGVKHGYWAYKSSKIYGNYRKGRKHFMWKRFDANDKKYKSFYRRGELIKGEGVGNDGYSEKNNVDSINVIVPNDSIGTPEVNQGYVESEISSEYKQTIAFLTDNFAFKKALKEYFGKDNLKNVREIKKMFKKNRFQFILSPSVLALDISKFLKASKEGKIVVAKIDSVLENETEALKLSFNGNEIEKNETLYDYATIQDNHYPITVIFSKVNYQLLRIDVVWNKLDEEFSSHVEMHKLVPDNQKFQLLLYFDDEGTLRGAEYEKP